MSLYILGREKDRTLIIFATMGDDAFFRGIYRDARKKALAIPLENLQAFLAGIDE